MNQLLLNLLNLNNMIDPIIGGALIKGGASILGNLFGASSTNKTNETNYKIAQMNNEWSERMMQKQMDYNTEMWNKQNEYNDPSKQVERLRAAGINPALALSNISTGSAQSASSPSLPSPSGATMQSFRPDFSNLGEAVNSAYQLSMAQKKNDADIDFMETQSQVLRARAAADIALAYERADDQRIKNNLARDNYEIRKGMEYAQYQNELRRGRSMEENIALTISTNLLKQKELAIFDRERAAGVANTIADTLLKYEMKKLTKQQAITDIQRMYKTAAEAQGVRISNGVARRSADAIVQQAINASTPNSITRWFNSAFGDRFREWTDKMKWKPVNY